MAQHRRTSQRKLAPTIVLLLSIASVVSPLALLFMSEEKATASSPPPLQFAVDMPKVNVAVVLTKAKRIAPTYTAKRSTRTPTPTQSTASTRQTSSQPSATTRTTPPTPTTVARQRAIQRAPSSTLTAVRHPPSTPATPVPAKPSAAKPSAAKVVPKPPMTTAPKPSTTTPIPKPTSTPTTTKETTTDPPKVPSPPPSHQRLVQIAQKYVGVGIPYRMGGNSLSGGMDCSHFVWMVLKEAEYNVQYRDSSGLSAWTAQTRTTSPQPGDLVLFTGHVGIYTGSGMMIDQGSSGGAHLRQIKYYDNFIGYGRLPI